MKNLDKYKSEITLSDEEMDLVTNDLVRGKFNQERRDAWAKKLATQHQVERGLSASDVKSNQGGRLRVLYLTSAMAAAILLAVIALPLLQPSSVSSKTLAMEYLEEPYPNNLIKKDADASVSELRLRATEDYNIKNYARAVERYQQLVLTKEERVDDYLYLGLSELYLQRFSPAVQHLEIAQDMAAKSNNFEQEIDWFLGLAYLQNEQIEKAKTLLQSIVKNKNWMFQKASEILAQLG